MLADTPQTEPISLNVRPSKTFRKTASFCSAGSSLGAIKEESQGRLFGRDEGRRERADAAGCDHPLPFPAAELSPEEPVGFVPGDPEDKGLRVPDEPPAQVIAGEAAEGFLEDVLGVLGRAELEKKVTVEAFSMAFIQLVEVQRSPFRFRL